MIARVFTLVLLEAEKAVYQRLTWFAPVFILLAEACLPLLHPIGELGTGDYDFVVFGVYLLNGNLLILFSLIYSANLIAPEIHSGLARHVFVRPLRRVEWYFAKLIFALLYATLLSIICAFVPWLMALFLGSLSGVHYGGEIIHTASALRSAFMYGFLLSLPPVWAGVFFSLLLSSMSRNSLTAAGMALSLWLLVDIAKYPLEIEDWVFSSWLEGAWQPFANMSNGLPYSWVNVTKMSFLSSLIIIVPSALLSILILNHRNVTK